MRDFALRIPKTFELLNWDIVQKKSAIRAKLGVQRGKRVIDPPS